MRVIKSPAPRWSKPPLRKKPKSHRPVKPQISRMNANDSCSSVRIRGVNPFLTLFKHLFFPDRHRAFELPNRPLTGFEGGFAVWRAHGNHDARFADVQAAGSMHNADVSYRKTRVSLGAQPLHLRQPHLLVCLVNEVERSFPLGPFACITVEGNCCSTFRQ